jgi:hypothetical protein
VDTDVDPDVIVIGLPVNAADVTRNDLVPTFEIYGNYAELDSNPGVPLVSGSSHFDLSGTPVNLTVYARNGTSAPTVLHVRDEITPVITNPTFVLLIPGVVDDGPPVSYRTNLTTLPPFFLTFNRDIDTGTFTQSDLNLSPNLVLNSLVNNNPWDLWEIQVSYTGPDGNAYISLPADRVMGNDAPDVPNLASDTYSFIFDTTGPVPGAGGSGDMWLTPSNVTSTGLRVNLEYAQDAYALSGDLEYKLLMTTWADDLNDGYTTLDDPDPAVPAAETNTTVGTYPRILHAPEWISPLTDPYIDVTLDPTETGAFHYFCLLVRDDLGNVSRYNNTWLGTNVEEVHVVTWQLEDDIVNWSSGIDPTTHIFISGEAFDVQIEEDWRFVSYQWYLDGCLIPGQAASSISLPIDAGIFSGYYGAVPFPFIGYHTLTCYAVTTNGFLVDRTITFRVGAP